ncbi:MAG: molybdopterin/thiamine biosynthesis adenylyltransferase/rhodanese-related sulfurtransferase [Sphingobacteriales bacterium]|jgi:molybdopterin/thiamine biosynthesis adenylyltransferase/rhodanese-related sulfurtransferase
MLSKDDLQRYQRHIKLDLIGVSGQEKLLAAKVLVIGAGGLGSPVLSYLAAAGVGNITIVDGDVVDLSNLQRQVIFSEADLGINKAIAAKQKLEKLNPSINIQAIEKYFSIENALELTSKADVVIDGSDNFETRYLVNDSCIIANKPFVYGSIFMFDGQVSVFNFKGGPTYRCLFPSPPKPGQMPSCAEIGVMGVLPGIIGSLQASEAIKIICGIGEVLSGKAFLFNALNLDSNLIEIGLEPKNLEITSLESHSISCKFNEEIKQVSPKEFYSINAEEWQVIDVRQPDEYYMRNIGGKNIPLSEIENRLDEFHADKNILIHCQSGRRSDKAIRILKDKMPDLKVFNLQGGIEAIKK